MSNISLMYKIAGIAASATKKVVGSVAGGTALFNAAFAYKDYKESLYDLMSGLPPEEAAKIGLMTKLVRSPPKPGEKTLINVQNV